MSKFSIFCWWPDRKGIQQHCRSGTFLLVRYKYSPTSTSCQFKGPKHFGLKEIPKVKPADGHAEGLPWSAGVFWNAGMPARQHCRTCCNKEKAIINDQLDVTVTLTYKDGRKDSRSRDQDPGSAQAWCSSCGEAYSCLSCPPLPSTLLVTSFSSHPYFSNMAKWKYFFPCIPVLLCFLASFEEPQ